MKNSEFMKEAYKRIPNVDPTGEYSATHTDLDEGWTLYVEQWEIHPIKMNIEFHLRYKPSKNRKAFGLWGHKVLGSKDWIIGEPYRSW
jgi:hypothetical protein